MNPINAVWKYLIIWNITRKECVDRKFWPSKCLKSRHNLWFLLHTNVSKCTLHLQIVVPSSKFVSADYLCFRSCSFSYFTFWGSASGILPKKEELESSEKHWNITHSQSRFNRIGVEQHEKWKTRFKKQILLYIAKIRAISYWLWKTICFWPRQMYDPCRHLNVTYKAFLSAGLKVKQWHP